jgi:hypothetical protein
MGSLNIAATTHGYVLMSRDTSRLVRIEGPKICLQREKVIGRFRDTALLRRLAVLIVVAHFVSGVGGSQLLCPMSGPFTGGNHHACNLL